MLVLSSPERNQKVDMAKKWILMADGDWDVKAMEIMNYDFVQIDGTSIA